MFDIIDYFICAMIQQDEMSYDPVNTIGFDTIGNGLIQIKEQGGCH